jgi:hypothetical protein
MTIDVAASPDSMSPPSSSISNLAKALVAAGEKLKNPDKSKSGYNYKYTDLPRLLELYNPILAKHKLRIVQLPFTEEGRVGVHTMLLHESGEHLDARVSFPVVRDDKRSIEQVAGGAISYLRRYSLKCILSIESDEGIDPDDLDHQVSESIKDPRPPKEEAARLWEQCVTAGSKAKTKQNLDRLFIRYLNALRTSGIEVTEKNLTEQKSELFSIYGFEL